MDALQREVAVKEAVSEAVERRARELSFLVDLDGPSRRPSSSTRSCAPW